MTMDRVNVTDGIIIDGQVYALIKTKPFECEDCDLQELCRKIDNGCLCLNVFGSSKAFNTHFKKITK